MLPANAYRTQPTVNPPTANRQLQVILAIIGVAYDKATEALRPSSCSFAWFLCKVELGGSRLLSAF